MAEKLPPENTKPELPHDPFKSFLENLGLSEYYPEKITLEDVINHALKMKEPESVKDLCWNYLSQIMMVNSNARDYEMQKVFSRSAGESSSDFMEDSSDLLQDIMGDECGNDDTPECSISPLDVTLAVFVCCNPFLKQSIISKMVICRLAIPLIYRLRAKHLYCLSWGLKSLISERVTDGGDKGEGLLIKQPYKIVTFLRCGETSFSKSETLNNVLSDKSHHTFFHRNCPMGSIKRMFYTGTVEAAWFYPAGKENEPFKETIAFLNLRADAMTENFQVTALTEISNVIVVMLNSVILDVENGVSEILKLAHKKKVPVVFGIDVSDHSQQALKKAMNKYLTDTAVDKNTLRLITVRSKGKHKSSADITGEFRKVISDFITLSKSAKSMAECVSIFKNHGIKCDEDKEVFTASENKADFIMGLTGGKQKRDILPLQEKLWTNWSSLQKEYHRVGSGSDVSEKSRIETEMKSIRMTQANILNNMSPALQQTLQCIGDMHHSKDENQLQLFLHYLQQRLDEQSRKLIPIYSAKYQSSWNEWKKAMENNEKDSAKKLREIVDKAEVELTNASFGLEHIIREFGQMYESLQESKTIARNVELDQLPAIAAKLIQLGHPFEIMDGDASNIPISWVSSVFTNLQNLLGNKKVLTISVLGIQSSGKSTLMNSMFGLEFAVKAGRCTRGVFVRLIPVTSSTYPFDYILVVDTEGLRAPELAMMKYDHDNELATFVIGMGDVTLINIKGENTGEVRDVLQIAVHAFMKLMLVNDRIKLQQSCMFIHQNVSAKDAKSKLVHATQKTVETLDKMTKEAAEQLNIKNIQLFKQVIHFDSQHHVWYFPDLWYGDPPMAPSNPGYSEHVDRLRHAILQGIKSRSSYLTLSETSTRIQDLWKGILSEDFVFSFRNTLEIKAYNLMEAKFQEFTSNLKSDIFNIYQNEIKMKLAICEAEDELKSACDQCIATLMNKVSTRFDDMKKELSSFFDKDTHKEILAKWKEKTLHKFQIVKDENIENAVENIKKKKEHYRLELLSTTELANDEREINRKAKELAENLKGKEPSDHVLKKEFEKMWTDWMKRYRPTTDVKEKSVRTQIDNLVQIRFGTSSINSYIKNMERPGMCYYANLKSLVGSIGIKDITENKEISIVQENTLKQAGKKLASNIRGMFSKEKTKEKTMFEKCAQATIDITNLIFEQAEESIRRNLKVDDRFNSRYIDELLDIIKIQIHASKDTNSDYSILETYIAKLIVHICNYAAVAYDKMNERYESKHGWKAQMEEYRKNVWDIFYNCVRQKAKEYTASTLLKNVLVEKTIEHVSEIIVDDIKNYVKSEVGSTKHALITMVLDELAEGRSFKDYMSYASNAKAFALHCMSDISERKLFDEGEKCESEYCKLATSHIQRIYKHIEECIRNASDGNSDIDIVNWLSNFVSLASFSLPLSLSSFRNICNECPECNIAGFTEYVSNQITVMKEETIEKFQLQNRHNISWPNANPISELFEELWGCDEDCPFCREPCQYTIKGHSTSHKCLQHRPAALIGTYEKRTNELALDVCNFNVMRERRSFGCGVCRNKCRKSGECDAKDGEKRYHYYRDYKKFMPEWDIAPDNTIRSSDYWAWVINKYQDQINEKYEVDLPEIPESWTKITKDEAKSSLRKIYG